MQVNFQPNVNLSKVSTPKFTGSILDEMNKPMSGVRVFKNATKTQVGNFKAYLIQKSGEYDLGMTPSEANNILKYDGDEFILNSYNYLTKKMGFPDSVRPVLMPAEFPAGTMQYMRYIPSQNIIQFNPEYTSRVDKVDNFTALRHELQHYSQNMKILRHEDFGEKAIDAYTDNFIKIQQIILENLYDSNQILEFLKPGAGVDQKLLELLFAYKISRDTNDTQALGELFKQMGQEYQAELLNFRNNVRNEYGVIKSDSPETKKIAKIFDEFNNVGYFKQNNEVDYNKYFSSYIEQDAILSQLRAGFELSKEACFMRFMNNEYERMMKNDFLRAETEKIDLSV